MLHDIGYLNPKRSDELHSAYTTAAETYALGIEQKMLKIGHDELGAGLAIQ